VSPDELQALIEEATYDYVTGEVPAALEKLDRATAAAPDSFEAWHAVAEINLSLRRLDDALAAAEKAHALRKNDPLIIATLSRTWMERGDKAKAEHYGAMARVQGWKEELSAPPSPPDASGLH
jgi:Flp pilus assembly protein TadD